jgi:hypothetical protein
MHRCALLLIGCNPKSHSVTRKVTSYRLWARFRTAGKIPAYWKTTTKN